MKAGAVLDHMSGRQGSADVSVAPAPPWIARAGAGNVKTAVETVVDVRLVRKLGTFTDLHRAAQQPIRADLAV